MATIALNLHNVKVGGSITEDVLDQIFALSPVDLRFQDNAGSSSVENDHFSWMEDELNPIDIGNQREDNETLTGNDHVLPSRIWNNTEMRSKIVALGDRAQAVDSIGAPNLMSNSISKRNVELRKEYEGSFLSNNASIRSNTGVAAVTAGVQSFIKTNAYFGVGGSAGGWNETTGLVDAPTLGTVRPMSETMLHTAEQDVYDVGGEPTQLISTPAVIGQMAKFFAGNSGTSATLYSNVVQSPGDGMTVKSAVKIWEGNFLTLELVSSRELQLTQTGTGAAVLLMDWDYWETATLAGIHGDDLAKTTLGETKILSADKGVKCLLEKSSAQVNDIDPTAAMIS